MLAGVLFMEDVMQTNDHATKEDVARVEARLAAVEGLLNEVQIVTAAIRDLTAAIKSNATPQFNVTGDGHVSASIVGGWESAKAENKRNRAKPVRRTSKKEAGK